MADDTLSPNPSIVQIPKDVRKIWLCMQDRCYNPKNNSYHRYGGRGIRVCNRWRDSIHDFYSDIGPRPSPQHSIDRYPNNDGNYEPGNVRWATSKQQSRNTRRTKKVNLNGADVPTCEVAESIGCASVLLAWFLENGGNIEDAIKDPNILLRKNGRPLCFEQPMKSKCFRFSPELIRFLDSLGRKQNQFVIKTLLEYDGFIEWKNSRDAANSDSQPISRG